MNQILTFPTAIPGHETPAATELELARAENEALCVALAELSALLDRKNAEIARLTDKNTWAAYTAKWLTGVPGDAA